MLLMIDNYDSFTYNLVQYFAELGETVEVHRNDKITRCRGGGAASRSAGDLPGTVQSRRGRHFGGGDQGAGGEDADPRRLSRPSGDRSGLRRDGSCVPTG